VQLTVFQTTLKGLEKQKAFVHLLAHSKIRLPPPAGWGSENLDLELPLLRCRLHGISARQKQILTSEWPLFIADSANAGPPDTVCEVSRLEAPIGIPIAEFDVDGVYACKRTRLENDVNLLGFEFVGHFQRCAALPLRASLAFFKEEELTANRVLENLLRVMIAYRAIEADGLLLHSAGVVHSGGGYVFSGYSNAGKTTLSTKALSAGAMVLSDDMNLLVPQDGAYRVRKMPFAGELGQKPELAATPAAVPLEGLILLEKAPELTVQLVSRARAVAGLLANCPFVNEDAEEFSALMSALTRLVDKIPVIRLGVARNDPFDAIMATVTEHLGYA
jgi:hypothetical protein